LRKLVAAGLLVFVGAFALRDLGAAQGGTYRGPGDTVPHHAFYGGPDDTLGGHGGARTATAFSLTDSLSGLSASSRATSKLFDLPFGPLGPRRGGVAVGVDFSDWRAWWRFNQHLYFASRLPPRARPVQPGSDEFFVAGASAPTVQSVRNTVAAALLRVLREPRSDDEQAAGVFALAKLGDRAGESTVFDALTPFLAASNRDLADSVPFALGLAGGDTSIDWLRELLLADSAAIEQRGLVLDVRISTRMQAYAAYGLGLAARFAEPRRRVSAVETLVEAARRSRVEHSIEVGAACVLALGLVALPFDAQVAAGRLGPAARIDSRERQVQWLLEVLDDRTQPEVVRARVPETIARLLADAPDAHWLREAVDAALCPRIARISDETRLVRIGCVIALGALGDADDSLVDGAMRATLLDARDDTRDREIANLALIALARGGGRPGSSANPFAASLGLRDVLLDAFERANGPPRSWAALALGVFERALSDHGNSLGAQSIDALRTGLDQARSPDEIAALATALGIAGDTGASAQLLRRLDQVADSQARGDLAVAVGLAGERTAIEHLETWLREARFTPELQRSTAIALALLDDADVAPILGDLLADSLSQATRASSAAALGWIGDVRASDALLAAVDDSRSANFVRALAISALGRVADAQARQWNNPFAVDVDYWASTPVLSAPESGSGVFERL
jgi:HEAT repeat protein